MHEVAFAGPPSSGSGFPANSFDGVGVFDCVSPMGRPPWSLRVRVLRISSGRSKTRTIISTARPGSRDVAHHTAAAAEVALLFAPCLSVF